MSAELGATLAVGAIMAALILAYWYDMRRNFRTLSAETRAEIQGLREDLRADNRGLRTGAVPTSNASGRNSAPIWPACARTCRN